MITLPPPTPPTRQEVHDGLHSFSNSLIYRMIREVGFKKFTALVMIEYNEAKGLMTWEACIYLVVSDYYNEKRGDKI